MTNASRAQIDLEALARDLRHEDGSARAAAKADPLAELARIVGQDDPFRALLAARNDPRSVQAPEVSQDAAWPHRAEPHFAPEEAPRQTPADAFDQYLASVERDMHAYPDAEQAADGELPPEHDESYDDTRSLRRAGPRRRLTSVGAGLAVVAIAVAGALAYKGLHHSGDGSVPVIQADTTPLKVAPKVADGVEIPDQNRQIYDRNATSKDSSGQIKVVNREEQPLDVTEAARAAGGTPSAQGTTPGNGPFEAFGEPRRVRTVSVKPEAPPAPPPQAEAAPPPAPVPTMVLPGGDTASAPPPPAPIAAKPVKPVIRQVEATPAAPTTPEQPAAPAPKPVAAPKKAPQRVASVSPDQIAAASPETTQATSAVDTTSPVSGFSVQLGVRGSASDAHAAFRQLQSKYSQLAGKPELIRQAEVNGKTIFRVRVGPLSKEEASSLCSSLQGGGGQCFVAKN